MYRRYAIYVIPDQEWGDFGAAWLGWDTRAGSTVPLIEPALSGITERPRKYGFHGTIKAPFHLAKGQDQAALVKATFALAHDMRAFSLSSLQVSQIGSFFALTAPEEHAQLRSVADRAVTGLDMFRAPLTDTDLQRRRVSRLTQQQDANLEKWGYPYVFDDFKFHLTLTGPVKDAGQVKPRLVAALQSPLSKPLSVRDICVCGEAEDGRFYVVERCAFGA
ncbi:MAG: DUF1045 domain-containing protein [Pseudomonadota bacterium]